MLAGLLEKDQHLIVEVNLGDMEAASGEQEEYWLLIAITIRAG